MESSAKRDFDLILVGATGFVGRLTAAHLAEHAPAALRIGLAGRSADRLAAARSELPDAAGEWPLITVQVTEAAAARQLAGQARVVVSAAGPYLRCGLPLVGACAEAGTHYADLSGETLFVHRSIEAADERARQTGAKIVHSCGFDSVPSDLGVGLMAQQAAADGEGGLVEAVLHVRSLRGGISGGTIDSLRQQILEGEQDEAARALTSDPQALVDDPSGRLYGSEPGTSRGPLGIGRDGPDDSWSAPFVMGVYNRQIVMRSNFLSDWSYGREFRYREVVDSGRGLPGLLRATSVAVGGAALMAGMWLAPTRAVLDRLLPDPGQGPSAKSRKDGKFHVEIEATTTTGRSYRATVGADLDPGYDGTAVMLGESGLSLVCDDLGERAGVLTPMTAIGPSLAARLRTRGFTVSVERKE